MYFMGLGSTFFPTHFPVIFASWREICLATFCYFAAKFSKMLGQIVPKDGAFKFFFHNRSKILSFLV